MLFTDRHLGASLSKRDCVASFARACTSLRVRVRTPHLLVLLHQISLVVDTLVLNERIDPVELADVLIAQTRVYPLLADVVAPLLLLHLDEGAVQLLESFASHHVGRQCVAFVFRVDRSTFDAKEFVLPSAIVLRESIDVCHVGTDI